jgi:hypothetical protein
MKPAEQRKLITIIQDHKSTLEACYASALSDGASIPAVYMTIARGNAHFRGIDLATAPASTRAIARDVPADRIPVFYMPPDSGDLVVFAPPKNFN